MIGHLDNESHARTFSDYLYVTGIKNQVEGESDGTWAVWILAEDELEKARGLLDQYRANPDDAAVKRSAEKAETLREREEQELTAARKRQFNRDQLFPERGALAGAPLTLLLIAVCVLVYVVREWTPLSPWTDYLFISNMGGRDLPEVASGQIWRLLTPIFLHSSYPLHLHILFNMLWLRDLGTMIENRIGTLTLGALVLTVAITSNLAQYFVNGPRFLGMSGVVYGLLGYAWMKGRFDPGSGLFLHPSTVTMMLIWLLFGYTNVMHMANTVHAVGLTVGVIWGYVAAQMRR